MILLSHDECIHRIEAGETLHASINEGAFEIHIEEYSHSVCTAIHAGHRLRTELLAKCALSDAERFYEEDPYTDKLIENQPITVIACDSRFEYDLNRAQDKSIYEQAWGKTVWKQPLTEEEKTRSLAKHAAFYRVLGALYKKLESLHPAVITYDVHSYNYQRPGMADTPVFNIGTEQIDTRRWQTAIDHWQQQLDRISLPGIQARCAINEVFYGRGYHATFVKQDFHNTLILPTEVKKIFMDERSGQVDERILAALQREFDSAITRNSGSEQVRLLRKL